MFTARLCVVRYHYDSFHPNAGIHLMKLGKIQLYIEQFAAAEKSLQQVGDSSHTFTNRFSGPGRAICPVCVCVWTMTCEWNDIWPGCLTWFNLPLYVQFEGEGVGLDSRSQDEHVHFLAVDGVEWFWLSGSEGMEMVQVIPLRRTLASSP